MLGAIIKALQILINEIKDKKTPEKKRQKAAQQLKKLYFDIDKLVESGKGILALLNEKPSLGGSVLLERLKAKQNAIEHLLSDLKDKSIKSIVKLHLPRLKKLQVLLHIKQSGVAFLLSQLTTDEELKELSSSKENYNILRDKYGDDALPYFMLLKEDLEGLDKHYYHYYDVGQSKIFTTDKSLEEFEQILRRLQELGEKLRLFLIEKFKFEDLL